MTSVQMHLALTHVPVLLSMVGLVMLSIAFIRKNNSNSMAALIIIVIAAIAAIPVFLTGEGAEEAVEHLPGVAENLIETHEKWAKAAMVSISIAGLVALAALLLSRYEKARMFKPVLIIIGCVTSGILVQTAHFGGQIRHTEITNSQQVGQPINGSEKAGEKDDD
ncbi:MAG: hypothetical protein JST81_15590 [Bacteroidetes bacterium]|nr:hypothetical protein [Bacteroidota bacterium]